MFAATVVIRSKAMIAKTSLVMVQKVLKLFIYNKERKKPKETEKFFWTPLQFD